MRRPFGRLTLSNKNCPRQAPTHPGAPLRRGLLPGMGISRRTQDQAVRHSSGRPLSPGAPILYRARSIGGSSNGRTADSDSASLGSNPSPPASKNNSLQKLSTLTTRTWATLGTPRCIVARIRFVILLLDIYETEVTDGTRSIQRNPNPKRLF